MVGRKGKEVKGISFPVHILKWIDKQINDEKNRSEVVVSYLDLCMTGKVESLDDMAYPVLKKMMSFFLTNKYSSTQLKRFKDTFKDSPDQLDYIDTIFQELK